MFYKLFALFALFAVAFANPKPDPQVLTYTAPGFIPGIYSGVAPGLLGTPYAALPYAYNPYLIR